MAYRTTLRTSMRATPYSSFWNGSGITYIGGDTDGQDANQDQTPRDKLNEREA